MLFAQEIRSLLESEPHDSAEIRELKTNMLKKLDHRFPQSDITIIASLLDPRFQNLLDVKKYLKSAGCTVIEFMTNYWKDIIKADACAPVNTRLADNGQVKKSYINDMVERHSTLASLAHSVSTSTQTDLERECFLLLSMGGVAEVTNVLEFWKENAKLMPLLSQVAVATYCTPATSTPSERNFSTSGLVTNSKQSQITPENLDKVVFIHNNYEFLKKNCPSINM